MWDNQHTLPQAHPGGGRGEGGVGIASSFHHKEKPNPSVPCPRSLLNQKKGLIDIGPSIVIASPEAGDSIPLAPWFSLS